MSIITLLGISDAAQLQQRDLTTVDNVRQFLQTQGVDTQQNAVIAALIKRASAVIERWTDRELAPRTDLISRTFSYLGNARLDLAPFDLRAVDNVVDYAGDPSQATLAASDYVLGPVNTRDGVYWWLDLPRAGKRERRITVTGLWGMAAVPADVEYACIITVAMWLKRDVAAFSRTFNLDEGRTERPDALPSAARAVLQAYRIPAVC